MRKRKEGEKERGEEKGKEEEEEVNRGRRRIRGRRVVSIKLLSRNKNALLSDVPLYY